MSALPISRTAPVALPLAGYSPLPGIADELVGPDGQARPLWAGLLQLLAAEDEPARARRFARGSQYLREAGVFFHQYGVSGRAERDWPLSPLPMLLAEAEWQEIAAGLVERADLLEAVMADLYGPARLVADGHLPAALVARNLEWLRPLVGVLPRGGHFLHFIAFDIARNPDGSWFVLGDRTQAPSGAGFALENRVATGRVFPELFQAGTIHRLAGFFRGFRDTLLGMRGPGEGRAAILTPGPLNDTYFEHAYIARYLGIMLLQGEDLVVRESRAMVRTVAGLKPVDVLWRRLDSAFADPLELDPRSRIGTPGLIGALRGGNLTMVNALGSGLLETRGFLAFLPRISEALAGRTLRLPNIATWWCGQPAERSYVAENAADLVIAPALSNRLPFATDPAAFPGGDGPGMAAWLERNGDGLVGQERVTLSTTPVWESGGLVARPVSLRVFLARTGDGWSVMPGGYARIGRSGDTSAIALQQGGSVADVCVIADRPVPQDSMVAPGAAAPAAYATALPARAADDLFWLGRYVERVEGACRLLRAYHLRLADSGSAGTPVLAALSGHLVDHGIDATACPTGPLSERIALARGCAARLRDRFSVDAWQAIAEIDTGTEKLRGQLAPGDGAARALARLLRDTAALTGLVHDNMYRFTGWRFLTLGRALERADAMAWALAVFADPGAGEGSHDLALELGDSTMSHRRRYPMASGRDTLVELLALDGRNPRSVVFQFEEVRTQVGLLPGAGGDGPPGPLARRVLAAHAGLATRTPDQLDSAQLLSLRQDVREITALLSTLYFA